MDPKFLKTMEEKLLSEKNSLEEELSKFSHRNPKATETDFQADFPNVGDKDDENASEVAQFTNNLSLESELEKALRDVESALKGITSGSYGICKYCKSEINEKRLLARSTSSSCIQCKKTLTQEV